MCEKRTERLNIRCTKEEKEKLDKIKSETGKNYSEILLSSLSNENISNGSLPGNNIFSQLARLKVQYMKKKEETKDIRQGVAIQQKINSIDIIMTDLLELSEK